jgi:hypothetical protein
VAAPAALFAELVDDAGLFPPEELAMEAALARHESDAAAEVGVLSGRFVCPAARLDELQQALASGSVLRLALIVSPFSPEAIAEAVTVVAGDRRLELAGLEGPLAEGSSFDGKGLPDGVPAFAEIPVTGEWRPRFEEVVGAPAPVGVKIRCGGVRPELFPTSQQLAALVHACAAAGVPFKATAGLHHAVRYRDERTGFQHHGYLNLLIAAGRAASGGDPAAIVEALDEAEPDRLVAEAHAISPDHARATRRLFVSYGSCSTSEPVEDLRALGLLAGEG